MKENDILVSVVMTLYNDEPFVLRTLENVKAQTYQNIELILSDDCSTDNTVAVCREWIKNNSSRFANVQLITTEVNTGVTANCIRAIAACHGQWSKGVGGDNLLALDAIERFVDYVKSNPDAEMVQCRVQTIDEDDNVIGERKRGYDAVFHDDRTTASQQYQLFHWFDPVEALGLFKNVSLLKKGDFYDTDFRNQEDTPFAYRILKAGHKIWYINQPLIKRRMMAGSLSGLSDKKIVPNNQIVRIGIDHKYLFPDLSCFEKLVFGYRERIIKLFFKTALNNKNKFHLLLWRMFNYPSNMYIRLKTKALKKKVTNTWN